MWFIATGPFHLFVLNFSYYLKGSFYSGDFDLMLLVFGSINMDIIIETNGFPKPGETFKGGDYKILDGGKGANQAIAAQYAGASKTYMIGCVGHDRYGDDVLHNLRIKSVVPSGVARSDSKTGIAVICINEQGENIVVLSPGANLEAKADQIPDSFFKAESVVLMQMEVTPEENWDVVERAHKAGSKVILNVAPALDVPSEILDKIDYLIVNEHEAQALSKIFDLDETRPAELAVRLGKKFGINAIITLSEKGSYASEKGENLIKASSMAVNAIDMTGAGDAFCGTFAACIEQGFSFIQAIHHASVAGALTCTKIGAQEAMPDLQTIRKNLENCPEPVEAQ